MKNIHLEPLGNGISVYVSDEHHFTTDTILLAHYSKPVGAKKCAELGTGCGTIPLLWARENKSIHVDAVEIQDDACELAKKSIEYNGLKKNIYIYNSSISSLKGKLEFGSYDIVACNPPYKACGCGVRNPMKERELARHEGECDFNDFCLCAAKLLKFHGKFFVCQRPERLPDVMEYMRKNDIEPKRLTFVQGRPGKPAKLFLLEGVKGGKKCHVQVAPTLIIEDKNGELTSEMLEVYGSYKDEANREAKK